MLPKRIMDSSSGSLSKLVIECESLGSNISSSLTHDSALIQKNYTINMYQKANYGTINENPTSKTTFQDTETQNDNIVNEDAIYGQGKSPIRSVLWNMLNQIIGTGLYFKPYINTILNK